MMQKCTEHDQITSWNDWSESRFTRVRMADGRQLHMPLVPPPNSDSDDGLIWNESPPFWLLPEKYHPSRDPENNGWLEGKPSKRKRGRPRKDTSIEPPTPFSPHELGEIRANNDWRPVDWRWRLAGHLVAVDEFPKLADDQALLAWYFRLARSNCRCDDDFERLQIWLPEVEQAWKIHQNRPVQLEVEARLLAEEPVEQIARKLIFPANATATFAALFFDVADRLDGRSWVIHRVIRFFDDWPKESIEQLGRFWKFYGYRAGLAVLEDLIYELPVQQRPSSPEEVKQFFEEEANKIIQRKACLALHLIPFDNPKAARQLFRAARQIAEIKRRQRQRQTDPEIDFMRNVRAAVEQLPPAFFEKSNSSHSDPNGSS